MKFRLTVIALSLIGCTAAFSQTSSSPATPRIEQRETNQEKRIQQGVASGELTSKEAARLNKGQERIDRMQDKAAADGHVTKRERAHIHHAQNKQDHQIKRQKHDRQKTTPAG